MNPTDAQPRPPAGPLDRLFLHIVGVDEETLRLCPPHDWDNVRAIAGIMICTWLYQTALFSIIAHRIFAQPGEIRLELIFVSMFLATFILLIDSYMVMRSGWHLSGIQELKRGGIDVSGGLGARVKAGVFLTIRILLSVCLAQLTAIFMSVLIFESDITSRIHGAYIHNNADLIAAATSRVDGDITRATDAFNTQNARVAALAAQVSDLRQGQIDPTANRPEMRQAQQELAQLLAEKKKADEAVQSAETFASNELAGIRGAQENSGVAGDGPRRRAAIEAVANAKDNAKQIAAAMNAARNRIDTLRKQTAPSDQTSKAQSKDELPGFEAALAAEEGKLQSLQTQLGSLTTHREEAIRTAVDAAPNHLPADTGLLTQITALEQIAQANPKIAVVIILIDVTSFGFELAAVLAKVTSFVPTTFAALLARDAYMRVVRLDDGMMAELNREDEPASSVADSDLAGEPPHDTSHHMAAEPEDDPFSSGHDPLSSPPRRPRGRPRKTPATENGHDIVPAPRNWNLTKM